MKTTSYPAAAVSGKTLNKRIKLKRSKDRRVAPNGPSIAFSSSTLAGDYWTSALGAYLPAVSNSGTSAYRRPSRAVRRTDVMAGPSLQATIEYTGISEANERRPAPSPLFDFSTGAVGPDRKAEAVAAQTRADEASERAIGLTSTSISRR